MKRLLLISLILMSATALFADVKWEQKEYDFGTWSEAYGLREGKVEFLNTGDAPVLIRRVRPSCGCTGVEYTDSLIPPGAKGTVKFNYNPEGRPGRFEKTIKVYLDDAEYPEVIRIRGTVIGSEQSVAHRYPVECGSLRLSERVVDFGDVVYGKIRHSFISVYNASSEPVTPKLRPYEVTDENLPVDITFSPETVSPGDTQTISIYVNTSAAKSLGRLNTVRTLCAGDQCVDLDFSATVLPDGSVCEDLTTAPMCELKPHDIELGSVKRGKKVNITFTIANTGKSELVISRIYSPTQQVKINKFPSHIKAGKEGKVSATLTTDNIAGNIIRGSIEIVTNDPVAPLQRVRFVGNIQ